MGLSSRGGGENENELVDERFLRIEAKNVYNKVLKSKFLMPNMKFNWVVVDVEKYGGLLRMHL